MIPSFLVASNSVCETLRDCLNDINENLIGYDKGLQRSISSSSEVVISVTHVLTLINFHMRYNNRK